MGQKFGATNSQPLLVAVRSGASVSMPGMLDTILNIGLNDQVVEALAARTSARILKSSQKSSQQLRPVRNVLGHCGF